MRGIIMSRVDKTGKSIASRLQGIKTTRVKAKVIEDDEDLEEEIEKPKREKKINFDDSAPGKVKRTFYLTNEANNKLNRINAKMMIKGDKVSLSNLIEQAIEKFYDLEMNERFR